MILIDNYFDTHLNGNNQLSDHHLNTNLTKEIVVVYNSSYLSLTIGLVSFIMQPIKWVVTFRIGRKPTRKRATPFKKMTGFFVSLN